LAELFASAVKTSLESDYADASGVSHFLLASAFLRKGDECPVFGFEFGQCVTEGVELFAIDRGRGFGDFEVFLLFERGKQTLPTLTTKVVDAGIARHAEEPGFKLGRLIETWEGAYHFNEDNLGKIFDSITSSRDGINKPRNAMLISDDEGALRVLAALLRLTDKVRQCRRFYDIHAGAFSLTRMTREVPGSCVLRVSCKLPDLFGNLVCRMHVSRTRPESSRTADSAGGRLAARGWVTEHLDGMDKA
jgi:hypothetical protein